MKHKPSVLGDFSNLENGLVLAVATNFVDALLGFVADSGNFVGLDVGFDDFGGDCSLGYSWSANLHGVAIDNHQRLKGSGLAIGLNQLHVERLAFGDQVLLATGLDNCFFHIALVYQNLPPL